MAGRIKTKYPGVFYRDAKRIGGKGIEKVYYVVFKKNGKSIEAKAGRQYADDMTPARAAGIRADLIEGRRLTRKEERVADEAKSEVWTIDNLWKEYRASRKKNKALSIDTGRYEKYLKPSFAKKEPKDILPLDIERLKRKLLKKKSPQTVKHVLNLLTWIINFGVKKGLCTGLPFKIEKPEVHNEKTEDLTPDQLKSLLKAIKEDTHPHAGNLMLLALYSGMRRSEMLKLKWSDIDYEHGFIYIRAPKGGEDQKIPLNNKARALLESHKKSKSQYIFPGAKGRQRTQMSNAVNKIKKAAGLREDFRPLHGLRHVFASMLASSGQVDMYTLQKLLTHKDPRMTQRYAHLRDEALKKASELAGDIIGDAIVEAEEDEKNEEKVVNLKDRKK